MSTPAKARRQRRDPKPHFKADLSGSAQAPWGVVQDLVPQEHLAWRLRRLLDGFDVAEAEGRYSSLGTHGYEPRWVLRTWVYASLVGLHHSTQVAKATQTDAAFRLLTGGYTFSQSVLRKFRARNSALFARACEWTVEIAMRRGWLDPEDLSVDSLRVQANASPKEVRTRERSLERLAELAKPSAVARSAEEQAVLAKKVEKHQRAVDLCQQRGTTSVVLTNPAAALMKFPSGASGPGHRVTLTAAGQKRRFALGVIVDAATNDYGKLEGAIKEALRVLQGAGLPPDRVLQVAADAGYWSEIDLLFAEQARGWADVLVAEGSAAAKKPDAEFFGREDFTIHADGRAICPAKLEMKGPMQQKEGRVIWQGNGCQSCALKPKCTKGKVRSLTASLPLERARTLMRARMGKDGAKARYNRRIATVEPVFSYIEDVMRFRRASCRLPETVKAEILLKVLAYNLKRLLVCPHLTVVFLVPWPS